MERGFNKNDRIKVSWDDMRGNVETGVNVSSWTVEAYRDTAYRMPFLRHNQDDDLHMRFQLSHRFKLATSMKLHAHIMPMASSDGNVYWEYQWFWGKIGTVVPAVSGWNTGNIVSPILGADQYKESVISLLDITNDNSSNESSILRVYLSRLGTDGSDTYSGNKDHGTAQANLGIDYLDVHFQTDKHGTDNDLPPFNN